MSNSQHGWFSDWDSEVKGFQPVIQTKCGIVSSLDVWFPSEADCDEFIRDEVLGEGQFNEQ